MKGFTMSERHTAELSQCQVIGEPPVKTWDDYRRGCLATFGGGHHGDGKLEAFQHGMATVFNLLEREFPPAEECRATAAELAALRAEREELRTQRAKLLAACRSVQTILGCELKRAQDRELEVRWECIREAVAECDEAIARAVVAGTDPHTIRANWKQARAALARAERSK